MIHLKVHMNKLFCLILSMICVNAYSQILDDSTELVYGPSTLKYYQIEDQKDNILRPQSIDTTLYDLGNFTEWDRSHKQIQDLGANGTAIRSLYFTTPEMIGLRSGYDAYDPIVKQSSDFRFFDTKSPFMNLMAAFGGEGRSLVDFTFSRNIKPNINFGFDIERLTTDKQIGRAANTGDRNAEATNLDLNGFYRSKSNQYTAMFYVHRFVNTVNETGGVLLSEDEIREEVFAYEDAPIRLRGVEAKDVRVNVHLYHEYRLARALQVYHEFDFNRQKFTYFDAIDAGGTIGDFNQYTDNYPNFFLDSLETRNAQSFRALQNETGIKGDIAKGFYRVYIKRRDVLSEYRYTTNVRAGELYVGGTLRYDLDERNKINANAEFLQTGDFKITGDIYNRFFEASYKLKQYQPTLLQQRYFGNHFFWNNDFQSVLTNEISGTLKADFKFVSLRPKISLSTISNFVYFDQDKTPRQADENLVLTNYSADIKFRWFTNKKLGEYFGFDNKIIYATTGGGDADKFRVPEFFYFGKFFWEGFFFENSLQVQVGADLMYRSAFDAPDYSFATQQFYLRDDDVSSYFLADVFLNFKVEKVRIFFKWNHFNQRNNDGFQITPLYPGQQSVIDLGVNWLFFD